MARRRHERVPAATAAAGWEVQDPEVMWRAERPRWRRCWVEASVVGIGVSTTMHGLIGLDAGHRAITPLLTWADSRAAEQAMALRGTELGRRLHHTSGTPVHSMSHLTKLLWYGEHEPDLLASARWWVGLKDFIVYQLTGQLVTEVSNASGTGLLDLSTLTWNTEALELVGWTPTGCRPSERRRTRCPDRFAR